MTKVAYGVVHGKTIELSEDIGMAEGEQVEITVRRLSASRLPGEGLRRCAGALADDWTKEDDRILAVIYQDRKQDSRKDLPE
jgi:hypothetical protein